MTAGADLVKITRNSRCPIRPLPGGFSSSAATIAAQRDRRTRVLQGKDLDVRSAGTAEDALVRVNERMLDWADLIFVMDRLRSKRFNGCSRPIPR